MSCICCVYTIHILTKIFLNTNYNTFKCHVYVVYTILYIYWLKYFDIPIIKFWYVMYMLCTHYTYTDNCFIRDMTQPQVSTLCSWSSNISACLDRQPIWRGSILLLSTCVSVEYVWQCGRNFGRPQPRVGCLSESVARTEKILRKSLSEASKRGWATKRASEWPSYGICLVYTWYIPGISLVYPVRQ